MFVGRLEHTDNSMAEGYNVRVIFYLPPFLQFVEVTSNATLQPTAVPEIPYLMLNVSYTPVAS